MAMPRRATEQLWNLGRRISPLFLKRFLGDLIMRLVAWKKDVAVTPDGNRFVVTPDRVLLNVVLWGKYERGVTAAFDWLIQQESIRGGTFVDVGANFGWYTTRYCMSSSGSVVAYEPASGTAELLRRNLALNGLGDRVDVREKAASTEAGTGVIEQRSRASGLARIDRRSHPGAGETQFRETVEIVRLDEDLADVQEGIVLMKVDVEGHEPLVLEGAAGLLGAPAPVLIVELNDDALKRAGSSREEVLGILKRFGYRLFAPDAGLGLVPTAGASAHDVIAIPPKRLAALGLE